ncbi:MAG: FCD domain-containing protein [Actinomycetaceae bacterium]|nr:FCD domain-containing protein [Actinomycetaceae bacterium]
MNEQKSRFQDIINILGPRIVDSNIPCNSIITLAEIEAEFECSRTVAREVQRSLEGFGLVRAQRRIGMIVQNKQSWNVFDPAIIRWRLNGPQRDSQLESLTALRLAIEPHAVAAAARFASKEQREEILHLGKKVYELGAIDSGPKFMRYDIMFHSRILQYCGNEMFAALSPVVESVLLWRTQLGLMPPRPEPRALEDHKQIAIEIYRGNPVAAYEAMVDLVGEVQEAFASSEPFRLRGISSTTHQTFEQMEENNAFDATAYPIPLEHKQS